VADRHRDLHGREFADTREATVDADSLAVAVALALRELRLGSERGKAIITVDWPHE
jgi:hypothetical protein